MSSLTLRATSGDPAPPPATPGLGNPRPWTVRGRRSVAAVVLVGTLLGGCATTRAPTSQPEHERQLIAYYDSGGYYADLARHMKAARKIVMRHGAAAEQAKAKAVAAGSQDGAGQLAIVFDIDETSLDNFEAERDSGFCFDPVRWEAWVERAEAKPIPAALELYQFARQRGYAIFFISGRKERGRTATANNLRQAGFSEWDGLFLKPDDFKGKTIDYKSGHRREIMERGYRIVVNIGDQVTDLEGGYSEASVLLPNPWYEVP